MRPIPILLYHSIADDPPAWIRPFAVRPEAFRRQLEALRASGVTALTVSQLVDALAADELPDRPALLTFDDGLADVASNALPALTEARLPATLYVTSRFVDGAPGGVARGRPEGPWLRGEELRLLADAGIEIGAHSRSHPHLDTLTRARARDEIAGSKAELETLLGAPVRSFAYPHGYSSRTVRRLVREAGFDSACAVGNALATGADSRFALSRLTVGAVTSVEQIAAWLDGRGAPAGAGREHLRTRGWRAYRRARAVVARRPGSAFPSDGPR